MTEIHTDEGRRYLVTVIDLYSRRIRGYATAPSTTPGWSSPR